MSTTQPNLAGATWRTSTYSGAQGDCIEVAEGIASAVPVRDSKDQAGPALIFTPTAWQAFVAGVLAGEFQPRH